MDNYDYYSSDDYRALQDSYIGIVAEAFGWDQASDGHEACYVPEELIQHYRALWRRPDPATGKSLRDQIAAYIFDEPSAMSPNATYVRQRDPAVMRLVDGMVEDYMLCLCWEEMAQDDHDASGADVYCKRIAAIDAVQAMIAAHGARTLEEQGYSKADTKKIIGSAIMGFVQLGAEEGKRCIVEPGKSPSATPATIVDSIYACAERAISECDKITAR